MSLGNVVLGLHKDQWHDTGAAVVALRSDGSRVVAHINQERLNREKHSRAFPDLATAACFRELGLEGPEAAKLIVLDFVIDQFDWRLDFRNNRCRTDVFLANVEQARIKLIRHHLCHAAASFFTSPFEEAAVLVVDGRGSNLNGRGSQPETQTLWIGSGNKLTLLEQSERTGIGALYEAVTEHLGFGFLEAGKTMGLAPFGAATPGPVLTLIGAFERIHTDYSQLCDIENASLYADRPPRFTGGYRERAAYDIQHECERAMLHLSRHARKVTGMNKLCLGGGVALNSVANAEILSRDIFDDIYINPACSDSGIALGAALWGFHALLDSPRVFDELSPYTGPNYPDVQIQQLIDTLPFPRISSRVIDEAVCMLAAGKVIGLFQGRSEMGPRALGNRSILMDPTRAANRDHLNKIVKRREPFRPFAPCVPLHHASRYFELDRPSPYMLMVVPVRQEWRERLAATTHIDGTARVQTVTARQNPTLHTLLEAFGERTGLPILLNTSFNVAGQPLVETPEDAVACFADNPIDGLLIGDSLLLKSQIPLAVGGV